MGRNEGLQVTQINCDRNWDRKKEYEDRIAASMRVFQYGGQRRSLGWLIHFVSMNVCKCSACLTDDREVWESCRYIVVAFDTLLDAISNSKLSAYDEIAAAPISNEMLPTFKLDPVRFKLKIPNAAGSITLRRADVVQLFPADKRIAMKGVPLSGLQNGMTKFQIPSYLTSTTSFGQWPRTPFLITKFCEIE
jgi:hypothetical protein